MVAGSDNGKDFSYSGYGYTLHYYFGTAIVDFEVYVGSPGNMAPDLSDEIIKKRSFAIASRPLTTFFLPFPICRRRRRYGNPDDGVRRTPRKLFPYWQSLLSCAGLRTPAALQRKTNDLNHFCHPGESLLLARQR